MDSRNIEGLIGHARSGVLFGLDAWKPGSGLTLTYQDGLVRQKSATNPTGFVDRVIQGSTLVVTASKDTYVYLTDAGAISSTNVANDAAKPKLATLGSYAEFLYKVVSDGTDITSVEDLRAPAGANLVTITVPVSFEATEVGDTYIRPGFKGRVLGLDGVVANALAGTDTGTVTPAISKLRATGVAITGAALSFSISASVGERDCEVATALNGFGAFDDIILTSAKSTAGGYAIVNVVCEVLG